MKQEIIEKNVKAEKDFLKSYPAKNLRDSFEDRKMRDTGQMINYLRSILGAKCIMCGGDFTEPNLKFFDYDVKRVQCYSCQNQSKMF